MNVHAYVVPVLGKSLFHGDVATVVASCANFLRDHPGYHLSIRRRDKGSADSGYAVLLAMKGGTLTYRGRLGDSHASTQHTGLAELTAEVLAVLHTMNIEHLEHPHEQDQHAADQ
jgi:hypothetical protein